MDEFDPLLFIATGGEVADPAECEDMELRSLCSKLLDVGAIGGIGHLSDRVLDGYKPQKHEKEAIRRAHRKYEDGRKSQHEGDLISLEIKPKKKVVIACDSTSAYKVENTLEIPMFVNVDCDNKIVYSIEGQYSFSPKDAVKSKIVLIPPGIRYWHDRVLLSNRSDFNQTVRATPGKTKVFTSQSGALIRTGESELSIIETDIENTQTYYFGNPDNPVSVEVPSSISLAKYKTVDVNGFAFYRVPPQSSSLLPIPKTDHVSEIYYIRNSTNQEVTLAAHIIKRMFSVDGQMSIQKYASPFGTQFCIQPSISMQPSHEAFTVADVIAEWSGQNLRPPESSVVPGMYRQIVSMYLNDDLHTYEPTEEPFVSLTIQPEGVTTAGRNFYVNVTPYERLVAIDKRGRPSTPCLFRSVSGHYAPSTVWFIS